MTQLLNHVGLTLAVVPFKNTCCSHCSVYSHVDKSVQKTRHKANLQLPHSGPRQRTLCTVYLLVFLCEFGLILLFGLDLKTGVMKGEGAHLPLTT